MIELDRPVLISDDEIHGTPNAFGYPIDTFREAVETKTNNAGYRDGVFEATELMLSQAAVAIEFVDMSSQGREVNGTTYVGSSMQLGFNDHAGGSESGHKILLNSFFEGLDPATYVLLSPPDADGAFSNTTFHRADFTFLSWEPNRLYTPFVPNPLKTASVCARLGRGSYHFYLVGAATDQYRLPDAFTTAGFDFVHEPYTDDNERNRLNGLSFHHKDEAGYGNYHLWPGQQFSAQIAQLRAAE